MKASKAHAGGLSGALIVIVLALLDDIPQIAALPQDAVELVVAAAIG